MFVKLLYFFSVFIYTVKLLLFICGCMTFFIGSVAGLVETSIYRLIAYSSITNVGLLFVSYSFLTLQGLITFIVFFIIYLSLIYLLFIVLFCVGYKYGLDILDMKTVEEGVLVYRVSWVLAFILTIILFSLVGLPPLIGFFSKYI
jgi:NADH:ubiquinone oxidoreductase subunit 2 (subunit N)